MEAPVRNERMKPWLRVGLVVLAAVLIGWMMGSRLGGGAGSNHASMPDAADSQIYRDVRGRIVRLAPEDGVMTVDHEAVDGLMPAMMMDLQLAEPGELSRFSAGDEIVFDLVTIGGVLQAVRLRPADGAEDGTGPEGSDSLPADPLGRGDLVPDLELYDPAGERFSLRGMEPRHRVITFFYVRCPLQDFCPTQSLRLSRLQERVAKSPSGVHLVSLTLDAEHDRPDVLAEYAERFNVDPARWTLAGAEDAEAIRRFANRAGGRIATHEGRHDIDHALIGLRVDGDRIVDLVYGIEAIEALVLAM